MLKFLQDSRDTHVRILEERWKASRRASSILPKAIYRFGEDGLLCCAEERVVLTDLTPLIPISSEPQDPTVW